MKIRAQILELYGKGFLKRSAVNLPGGEEAIEHFMTAAPVKVAVEIGTLRGVTSAAMAQWCGKLYTVDLHRGLLEKREWNVEGMRYVLWGKLGIKNVHSILVRDDREKERILDALEFDFAFIDGDHSFAGVRADFEMVKRCGRVLFHDYDRREGQDCPVRDFIDTIKAGRFEYTKDFAYWTA